MFELIIRQHDSGIGEAVLREVARSTWSALTSVTRITQGLFDNS